MEDQRNPKSWMSWLLLSMALLVAYPFSAGPVILLILHYRIDSGPIFDAVVVIYRPLTAVCLRVPLCQYLMDQYGWLLGIK